MKKNYLNKLHNSTKRNYLDRMINKKVLCMIEAKKYEKNYWDGDRKFGYGGYFDDGRWKLVAKDIINHYKLRKGSKILDVGCAKGFLVKELHNLGMNAFGIDISRYAISKSPNIATDKVPHIPPTK